MKAHKYIQKGYNVLMNSGNDGGSMDLEPRVAVLEKSIEHIERDISEIKIILEKIDGRFEKMDDRFEKINDRLWSMFVWIMGTIITISLALFGALITIMVKFVT